MLGRVPINAAAVFASRVVSAASGLAIAYVVVDRLGAVAFGRFAALLAAGAIANIVQTFGVDTTVVRAVADGRRDALATVWAALRLQLLVAAVATAVTVGAVVVGIASSLLIFPAAALFPLGVVTVASAVIRGVQQMNDLLIASVVSGSVSFATAILFIADQVGVAVGAVVAGQTAAALFLACRAVPHMRLVGGQKPDPLPMPGRRLLAEAWVFAAATVASAVLIQGSIVIFGLLGEGSGAGLAAGLRLVEAARLVPAAVFAALFPAMFDGVHRTDRYRRSFNGLVAYACLVTVGLVVLAPLFVEVFFDGLSGGASVIRILALSVPITVFRLRFSFELVAGGKERTVLLAAVVAVAVAMVGYVAGSLLDSESTVAWSQVAGGGINVVLLVCAVWREAPLPIGAAQR